MGDCVQTFNPFIMPNQIGNEYSRHITRRLHLRGDPSQVRPVKLPPNRKAGETACLNLP